MALTRIGPVQGQGSALFLSTVPANSLILVQCYWFPIPGTFTVSDNVNAGLYTNLQAWQFGITTQWGLFAKVTTTAGVPTVSESATDNGHMLVVAYTGFAGVPTILPADFISATGTGTAVNSGSFNASKANEFALAGTLAQAQTPNFVAGAPITASPLLGSGSGDQAFWDTLIAPSGLPLATPISMNGTLPSSDTWFAYAQGFYDGPAPSGRTHGISGGGISSNSAKNLGAGISGGPISGAGIS